MLIVRIPLSTDIMGKITDILESYYLLDGQSIVQVGSFDYVVASTMIKRLTFDPSALCRRALQCICGDLAQRVLY